MTSSRYSLLMTCVFCVSWITLTPPKDPTRTYFLIQVNSKMKYSWKLPCRISIILLYSLARQLPRVNYNLIWTPNHSRALLSVASVETIRVQTLKWTRDNQGDQGLKRRIILLQRSMTADWAFKRNETGVRPTPSPERDIWDISG